MSYRLCRTCKPSFRCARTRRLPSRGGRPKRVQSSKERVGAVKRSIRAAVLLAALSLLCAGAGGASAAESYVTVTPQNFNAIFNTTDVRPMSSYRFRFGPAKPPLGLGSLQLTTVDGAG